MAASLCAGALFAFTPGDAHADSERIRYLSEKMRDSDARVRTSAALSLGGTNDEGAVDPLCGGLGDREEGVRQAATAGLKLLNKRSALPCLEAHLRTESSAAVRDAISLAINTINKSGGGGDVIKDNPNAKYYISLSSVANATSRANAEVEKIVLNSVKAKLDAAGTVQLAPSAGETPEKARQVIKDKKLKGGFYLAIAIDNFQYDGGNLRVKVKIGVFNYPNKSLLGNVDKSLTAQGVSSGDKASEDRLLELAAGLASEQFANNASQFL
ncbi:MAG: HEAT repeat domain-containing protein [Labilithrix sp.]|nr:HEAT repeat domain-containing protein [Labilithrix sp.]MCW5812965.1 HEAT repeat domain-containing protein [Labilithrix sp.]